MQAWVRSWRGTIDGQPAEARGRRGISVPRRVCSASCTRPRGAAMGGQGGATPRNVGRRIRSAAHLFPFSGPVRVGTRQVAHLFPSADRPRARETGASPAQRRIRSLARRRGGAAHLFLSPSCPGEDPGIHGFPPRTASPCGIGLGHGGKMRRTWSAAHPFRRPPPPGMQLDLRCGNAVKFHWENITLNGKFVERQLAELRPPQRI